MFASRRQLKNSVSVAIAALVLVLAGNEGSQAFTTVVIDAGHGGEDPGSVYGIFEKQLTLDLALRIELLLKDRGINVILTRREDVYVELGDRAAIANKHPDTVFISLHFNAHPDKSISGIETYYMSAEGQKLGEMVQAQLTRKVNTKDRGVKKENLKVLRVTQCTAILIEGGFLSNRWEKQRCSAEWYRKILAEEIVAGLMRYRD
ncbi:MAG: N-acetylmuramoyl-L-alanine amidase [Verrucomicrobiales bacterium]|jgi:N-acetylmuramoyl-L-alanine amidase